MFSGFKDNLVSKVLLATTIKWSETLSQKGTGMDKSTGREKGTGTITTKNNRHKNYVHISVISLNIYLPSYPVT